MTARVASKRARDARSTASDALLSPRMRLAPLLLLGLAVAACDVPRAFVAPGGPPLPVVLDAQFRYATLGTWALDGFDEELATQLHR